MTCANGRYLDKEEFHSAGLDKTVNKPLVTNPQAVKPGDLFTDGGGQVYGPGILLYHDDWTPAPNNGWIEILHTAVPTELVGDWVFKLSGTNVWFNVGRTIVFCCAGDHGAAINFLSAGCSKHVDTSVWPQYESDVFGFCAREKVKSIPATRSSSVVLNIPTPPKLTDIICDYRHHALNVRKTNKPRATTLSSSSHRQIARSGAGRARLG